MYLLTVYIVLSLWSALELGKGAIQIKLIIIIIIILWMLSQVLQTQFKNHYIYNRQFQQQQHKQMLLRMRAFVALT